MNKIFFSIIFLFFISFQVIFAQNDDDNKTPRICTGGVVNSKATYFPQPEYPQEAKEQSISGVVNLQVSIDEQGNVSSAEVCSGHPLLRVEAKKAALKAKFKLTILAGQPVKVSGIIIYKFGQDKSNQPNQNAETPQAELEPLPIPLWVLNEKATSLPQPNYPKDLLQIKEKESIEVEVKIHLQEGKVVSAMNASKNSVLGKYAVEAAILAKFRPIEIEGRPLYGKGTIIYNFPPPTDQKPKVEENNSRFPIIFVNKIVNDKAKNLPKSVVPVCRCTGTLKDRIVINMEGKVINASTESGHPLLRYAVLKSAQNTAFSPTNINGPPIYVVAYLLYKFNSDGTVETDFSDDKEK